MIDYIMNTIDYFCHTNITAMMRTAQANALGKMLICFWSLQAVKDVSFIYVLFHCGCVNFSGNYSEMTNC